MIYKKKKPLLYSIISLIMYIGLTIFILFGLLNLLNFTNIDYNDLESSKLSLELKPIERDIQISNNIILEKKDITTAEPVVKDKKVLDSMKVIESYYINTINKNIKKHFSSNISNMCKIIFKVKSSELIIVSCDDFTFKRQVELAISKSPQYKNKIINGVDLSNEVVYFDYSISGSK